MIFPITVGKYKILKYIYENPGVKISDLLKKTKVSPSSGYTYIEELLESDIVEEKIEGKKPNLRLLKPKFSESGIACFSLIETEKKLNFFNKHKQLRGPFIHFENETRNLIDSALIFGSFARDSEGKDSDIDVVVLGDKKTKNRLEKVVENCFVTVDNKVSLRLFDTKEFSKMLNIKDDFAIQIINAHIVVVNAIGWIKILSSCTA